MNAGSFSLTPLLRQSVGFDRFNDLFESALGGEELAQSYPPYNIEKHGDDRYVISMAVAGFREHDLNIIVQNDQLKVSGKQGEDEADVEFLHVGIANRPFEQTFRLADHMQVTEAHIADGLLSINLIREIPEEAKPRMIPIQDSLSSGTKKIKSEKKKISN